MTDGNFVPPENLEEVVSRALAKKQDERYQTCDEFAADLMDVYEQVQPSAETLLAAPGTPAPFPPSHRQQTQTPRWTSKSARTGSGPARTPPRPLPPPATTPPPTPVPPTQQFDAAPATVTTQESASSAQPALPRTGPTQKPESSKTPSILLTP